MFKGYPPQAFFCSVAFGAAVTCGAIFSGAVQAENWAWEPLVQLQFVQDNNVALSSTNKQSATGTFFRPSARLSRKTAISEISLNGQVDWRRYFGGGDALDSDDYQTGIFLKRSNERNQWQLGLDYGQHSAVSSEALDTGLLLSARERKRWVAAPSWTYQMDSRHSVRLSYAYHDVDYNTGSLSLVDYKYDDWNATYFYQLTEKDQLSVNLNFSEYDSDAINVLSQSYGGTLGLTHQFSETLKGNVSLGNHRTNTDRGSASFDANGVLYAMGLTKSRDKATYEGSISSAVNPSGAGVLNQSDMINLVWKYRYSEKIDLVMQGQRIRNQSTDSSSASTDRKYWSFSPAVNWWLTPELKMQFSYRRAEQKFDASPNQAESDQWMIGLVYSGKRREF